MELIQELQKFGLKEKESKVFLATLELGSGSISEIAKKAGIKRPTVYNIITDLSDKGLIAKAPHRKRMYYIATSPEVLHKLLIEKQKVFEQIFPALNTMYRNKLFHPIMRFYDGKQGFRTVYEEFFSTHQTIYSAVSFEDVSSIFTEDENALFFSLLREKGGRIHDLITSSQKAEEYKNAPYRKGLGMAKFLPKELELAINMLVLSEKVAFFSFESNIAVVIEEKNIARTQQSLLKLIWNLV